MFCVSMWCSGSDYTDDRRHALTGMHNDCTEIKLGGGDIYGNFVFQNGCHCLFQLSLANHARA